MTKQFAHNVHSTGECSCPAIEAGFGEVKDHRKRTDAQSKMYEKYDAIARNADNVYGHILSERKARSAWQQAIVEVNDEKAAEFGRKVQEKLGWDDQMEENE